MNKFVEYYSEEIKKHKGVQNYVYAKSIEKKPLLDRVRKYANNKRIIEAGCGSASNSIFLANEGFEVTCIDQDSEILNLAKTSSTNFEDSPTFIKMEISELLKSKEKYDVAFSHGVLEHYSDEEIISLINSQLSVAEFVVISIPSNFFKQEEAINGDERFLDERFWSELISKTNGDLIEDFAYFYDSQEFRIKFLQAISKLTLNKLPLKKPYLGFVIGRK